MGWAVEGREAEEKVEHRKHGRGEVQRSESGQGGTSDVVMGAYVPLMKAGS